MQDNTIQVAEKRPTGPSPTGPQLAFAACVLASFATLAVSTTMLPRDLALPLTSTLLFVLAGLVAIAGWSGGRASEHGPVTYQDVAGALTFIGTFAASLIDPDQMVRVVEGTYRQN
jgi:hypothetical protein